MKPAGYFKLDNLEHKALFDEARSLWEVIPRIESYLGEWFSRVSVDDRRKGRIHESAILEGDVYVGEGATVGPHSYLVGPAIIGDGTQVAHGANIRSNVIIGRNCTVGHGCEVKNSVILNNTNVAHFNYVGDSVVGSKVNLGGGAKLANFRFDEKSIKVMVKEKKIDTGLGKLGAIIGDGSKVGVNAVLNPGTVLGRSCIVYPGAVVSGTHDEGSVVK